MLSHTWWISYLEYVILHNLLTCVIDIIHDNFYCIVFTPDITLKDELANTAIQITCYNRDGEEVKRVTSTDPGTVEDPEQENQGLAQEPKARVAVHRRTAMRAAEALTPTMTRVAKINLKNRIL